MKPEGSERQDDFGTGRFGLVETRAVLGLSMRVMRMQVKELERSGYPDGEFRADRLRERLARLEAEVGSGPTNCTNGTNGDSREEAQEAQNDQTDASAASADMLRRDVGLQEVDR